MNNATVLKSFYPEVTHTSYVHFLLVKANHIATSNFRGQKSIILLCAQMKKARNI